MASHLARWVIIGQNNLSLHIICFKLPWKLDVGSLQRLTLPRWTDFHVLVVRTATMRSNFCIFWCDCWHVSWIFYGVFLDIWSEPSILEVNILWCTTLWAALPKVCTIWEYCAFPHEWNSGNFIIKHHVKLRWYVTSCLVENQSYWSCMKLWFTNIDPCNWV